MRRQRVAGRGRSRCRRLVVVAVAGVRAAVMAVVVDKMQPGDDDGRRD